MCKRRITKPEPKPQPEEQDPNMGNTGSLNRSNSSGTYLSLGKQMVEKEKVLEER